MLAIEVLGAGVERRDEQKQVRAIVEKLLGELHQLRSDALILRVRRDRDRSNIGRTGEAIRCEQNESERSRILIACDKQLGPRPVDYLTAAAQIALQGDPRFGSGHQAGAPFVLVWLSGLDMDWMH